MPVAIEIAPGVRHYPGFLDRAGQEALRDEIRAVLAAAPPFVPRMPKTGKPFSVRMSNCGPLGWVSDDEAATATSRPTRRPARPGRRCRRGCWRSGPRSRPARRRPKPA